LSNAEKGSSISVVVKKRNLKKKKENKITFIRIQKGTLLKKLRISKIVDVNQNEVVRFTKMKTSLRG